MKLHIFSTTLLFVMLIVLSTYVAIGSASTDGDRNIVAITSTGPSLESIVSQNFGRCPFFIFYDYKEDKISVFENPGLKLESGAGRQAAELVIKHGATILVTGNIGDKVESQLKNAGIQIVTDFDKTITVKDVIEMFQSGLNYE